jgi:ubiquinol-cytochrome c reductase iron-sulfur subunit
MSTVAFLRSALRPRPTILRAGVAARGYASDNNPIGGGSYKVPDFSPYLKEDRNKDSNRVFSYFMVGSLGLVSAATARATVQDFLTSMSASADVLAMAKVEVGLSNIPEGKNIVIKWRGKPVFIRHRTQSEIDEANSVNIANLRDPETDEQRTKKPEWLVMIGICTHLGCVPIGKYFLVFFMILDPWSVGSRCLEPDLLCFETSDFLWFVWLMAGQLKARTTTAVAVLSSWPVYQMMSAGDRIMFLFRFKYCSTA